MADLSNEEKFKFSSIIFDRNYTTNRQIQQLNDGQRSKLKSIYAQKIAFQTVNAHVKPPEPEPQAGSTSLSDTSCIGTVCCCFFPENYRSVFDITSEVFRKRALSCFMVWRNNFLTIGEGRTELYGMLWMSITYIVILGFSANLNEYFIAQPSFRFQKQLMLEGMGITALFQISSIFIYAAVVKCLKGEIPYKQSAMLIGYSLILYIIPTFLCLIPSLYWHVGMMAVGGLLRGFFLFRNYSSKVQEKSYVLLVVIVIVEVLYCVVMLKTIFRNHSGYTFAQGSRKVFKHFLEVRHFVQ